MRRRGLVAVATWLAALAAAGAIIAGTRFTADLSAFLPQNPSREQQVLVDQLREGSLSRLILIGIEGADAPTRTALSAALGRTLRASPQFASVSNGDDAMTARDREILFANRYLLSPAITPERFTAAGLHRAIADSIDLLASPAGLMLKSLLPRDPSGELTQLLAQLAGNADAAARNEGGVWVSRDGSRAILLAQTAAAGYDTDGQEAAIELVRRSISAAQRGDAATGARLRLSGPAVFAVSSRQTIRDEAVRLSAIGAVLIVALLAFAYRSPIALLLGLLPVVSGAAAGVAAVSLGFGMVHGLTLGFGTTLIGEAVDYSIYLFVQSGVGDGADWRERWIRSFWPTVRLGMLTSLAGFATLLFSGFPGLAQLGLYSLAGIFTAALVTRFVLPELLPSGFRIHGFAAIGQGLAAIARRTGGLRLALGGLVLAATAAIATHRAPLWDDSLAALSPIGAADLAYDASLRADLGAPDARYLIVVAGGDAEAALAGAEAAGRALQRLVDAGQLGGFESPARYLPSVATQRARQAMLPQRRELAARPALALVVDALLLRHDGQWSALLPLRPPLRDGQIQDIDAGAVRAALAQEASARAMFVDMKAESDRLYGGYLGEAVELSLLGVAAIVALLLLVLRSPARVIRVAAPLAVAVLVVIAGLALAGVRMNILHLVGMLLIVAVGSNYALFFDRRAAAAAVGADAASTLTSLALANATTVAAFGVLALSSVPVLQAIGVTVAPGAFLALVFAAILAQRPVRAATPGAAP